MAKTTPLVATLTAAIVAALVGRSDVPAPANAPEIARVVVRPEPIDDLLVNPGMGIQTFQRFQGQALNPGLEWSEAGPEGALPDAPIPPDFPHSSVAYCRWFWSTLEPERGKVRWDIVDRALEQARAHKQTLAIRLMPYDAEHPPPAWYRESGARRAHKPGTDDGPVWHPDFGDPRYLKSWGALVAAAGARYDGHADLDTVDISSIGYWGEGWSDYMPAFEHQKALADVWFDAFPRTRLLTAFDEAQALAYAVGRGAGYRLDCLGDMRSPWGHMLDVYPQQIVRAGIQRAWERSPVSLETCWTPAYWEQQGWPVAPILEQALRWHVSSLNIKSIAIPKEHAGAFDDFQRKMGYRFVLRRLEYPARVRRGQQVGIHMWWLNAGVAPPYRNFPLAIDLVPTSSAAPQKSPPIRVPVDVSTWLPGDAVYDGPVRIPANLTPGVHRVRVAMLDARTSEPAIQFAIRGRQPDGWYDVGEIVVE